MNFISRENKLVNLPLPIQWQYKYKKEDLTKHYDNTHVCFKSCVSGKSDNVKLPKSAKEVGWNLVQLFPKCSYFVAL